jgi:hypothetical protein
LRKPKPDFRFELILCKSGIGPDRNPKERIGSPNRLAIQDDLPAEDLNGSSQILFAIEREKQRRHAFDGMRICGINNFQQFAGSWNRNEIEIWRASWYWRYFCNEASV